MTLKTIYGPYTYHVGIMVGYGIWLQFMVHVVLQESTLTLDLHHPEGLVRVPLWKAWRAGPSRLAQRPHVQRLVASTDIKVTRFWNARTSFLVLL